MKKVLLAGLCLTVFALGANAQNKTLGVGTATPNSNAALHVESPTNNQGAILPRLTTAERAAMSATLGAADEGLILFDKDVNAIFIWDGTTWRSTSDIVQTINSKAGSFVINNATATQPAVYGNTNGGFGGSSAGVVGETATAFAGVVGRVTAGFGNGVAGISNSPESGSWAVMGQNTGGGSGGWFMAQGGDATVGVEAIGAGTALYVNAQGTGHGVVSEAKSNGNAFAGIFNNTQSGNTYPAVTASTKGIGPGFRVIQDATSVGGGYDVFIQNPASTAIGVAVDHQGTGTAGNFIINNASNPATSLFTSTNGTGSAFVALTTGTARSAFFDQNNASTNSPAVTIQTNSNAGGTHAFETFHNGVGDAVYGKAKNGSGGSFWSDDVTNPASALFGYSNSTNNGTAIGAMHAGNGNAVAIFQGGMKVSTANVTSSSIATRAAAYNITGGGLTFTISFPLSDGEVFFMYNGTGSAITVNGVSITNGVGRTCIVLGGTLRGM